MELQKVIRGVTLILEVVTLADGPGGGFPVRVQGGNEKVDPGSQSTAPC